jgi:phosphoesterase RecJ-like protein
LKADLKAIAERFRQAGSLLLLTHRNPDGDGLGCMTALARVARAAGKGSDCFCTDEIPLRYRFLFGDDLPAGKEKFARVLERADLIVVLDTCSFEQLPEVAGTLRRLKDRTVVLDHHATGEEVGSLRWVDPTAAAVGVMVCELLDELNWPIDTTTAEALATAIVSDTGWLRFSNSSARTFRTMAKLVAAGVKPDELYATLYQSDRLERLKLQERLLWRMRVVCDGRLAVMHLRKKDFVESGARQDETENLINEGLRVGGVEVAALLVEQKDNVRVSLRSRKLVDVSAIARRFGGGGHVRAAGCRVAGDLDHALEQVTSTCCEAVRQVEPAD